MDKSWLKSYQPGVPATINPDAYSSLVALFTHSCEQFKDRIAYSNFGTHITFQKLAQLTHDFAAFLQQNLGCRKGDRFAIMLPNVLQYPIAFFGALQAGLIVTSINPLYTASELIRQVNDSGAETIIVLSNFAHTVQAALPSTCIKNVIVTELTDLFAPLKAFVMHMYVKYVQKAIPAWSIPHAISFKEILEKKPAQRLNPVMLKPTDIALLQYTGGTTGIAKGAILTHRNIIANVQQILAWISPLITAEHSEIGITPLPLYHIFSLTSNGILFIALGAHNVLITNPRDIPHLIKELSRVPFTMMTGVNTLFNALLNNPDFAKLDFSHLKVGLGGGAAIQKNVADRWRAVTGKVLLEGYGLTEASPVVTITPMNLSEYNGSIGLPVPSTDISLRDENEKEIKPGQSGELCVKGPQVMSEYWNNREETARVFTQDGWLKTGDIAYMDDNGFIYIVDRKKDMILVSGFNVYPNEIEEVIAQHSGVLEVAVVGIPDANTGEAVKAFIVKKDQLLTADALLAYCREHLTGYKLPRHIEFRDSLPKSPVGKILRWQLRELK